MVGLLLFSGLIGAAWAAFVMMLWFAAGVAVSIVQSQIVDGSFDNAPASIFIATTGSDTTGNGTSGAPYATLGKALSVLPKVITQAHTINVATGTYAEALDLRGFVCSSAGSITVLGDVTTPSNVTFTGTINNAAGEACGGIAQGPVIAILSGVRVNVTAAHGLALYQKAQVTIDRSTVTGTISQRGILLEEFVLLYLKGNITISGWALDGMSARHGCQVRQITAGTLTVTGPASGASTRGIHLYGQSLMRCSEASGINITITGVKYGFQLGLCSCFQHITASGTITVTNSSTPANSAGAQCTDNSSWSTTQTTTFDHLTASFEVNSISYAEATGTRNYTNTGAALVSQNGVVVLS